MKILIDDDDLDATASAVCDAALKWIIKPPPGIYEAFRFGKIAEDGQEIYRELALAVIDTLRERL